MKKTIYSSHVATEQKFRKKKALKIISILEKQKELHSCKVLDIGCGSGHIAHELGKIAKSVVGVNISDERVITEGFDFQLVTDENLPFSNQSFDIVISNHVIEHTPNQQLHLSEIHRVLKDDGILYLATPNKYALIEPHFKLPFLSWLPDNLAQLYTKAFRDKDWDVYSLSHKKIILLTQNLFIPQEWSAKVIKNLKSYHIKTHPFVSQIIRITPFYLIRMLTPLFPTFIFTMEKKKQNA